MNDFLDGVRMGSFDTEYDDDTIEMVLSQSAMHLLAEAAAQTEFSDEAEAQSIAKVLPVAEAQATSEAQPVSGVIVTPEAPPLAEVRVTPDAQPLVKVQAATEAFGGRRQNSSRLRRTRCPQDIVLR